MPQTLIEPKSSAQPDSRQLGDVYRAIAVCVFLVVAIAIVFGQTLWFGFLNYDDAYFVYDEPHVSKGFSLAGIAWTFTNGPLGEWYPLSMLSHMLDCELYGLHPSGHHLTNLLLHAATAIGLFLVLWRMTSGLWPSAVVASLFAIHPLHVESVAWIAERRDVLSGLFFVLILGAYDEYVRHPKSWGRYLTVFGLLALGLMAKSMLVTVPALLLLLDYWPLRRFDPTRRSEPVRPQLAAKAKPWGGTFPWRLITEKLPLLALCTADAAATMLTHSGRIDPLMLPERLANAAISYVAYLGQLFVPVGLSVYYSHPEAGRPNWQVALAVVILLAITTAAVIWRRSLPYVFVGWFWYVGLLVPVLGIAYVGAHARGDRYTYLSQIGLYIALVWSAMRLGAPWPLRRWVFGVGSAVILVALMACAWRQTGYWQSDESLWRHAVACDAHAPAPLYTLGSALAGKDDEAASEEFRQALEIGPHDRNLYAWARAKAHNALGSIAVRKQKFDEAIDEFRQAIDLDPTSATAHLNLAIQLAEAGNLAEAEVQFRRSIELLPSGAGPAYFNLATCQMKHGLPDAAIVSFRQAVKADDSLVMAHINLGNLLVDRGNDLDADEASSHFRRAIKLDPNVALPYYRLAGLLRKRGRDSEAARFEEQGVKASRRYAESQNTRGTELAQQGKLDEAISQFQMAINITPDFVLAYQNLADALAQQGRFDEAIAACQRALQIDPNYQPAKDRLQRLRNP
jgi:protein O-mannosyl-transferase